MKELLKSTRVLSEARGLTGLPETPYYEGGDIFMEGESDMPLQKPTSPERAEKIFRAPKLGAENPVSKRQGDVKRNLEQLVSRKDLPVELRRMVEVMLAEGADVAGDTQKQSEPIVREKVQESGNGGSISKKSDNPGSADSVIKAENEWFEHMRGRESSLGEEIRQRFLRAHGIGPTQAVPAGIEEKWKVFLVSEIARDPVLRSRYGQQTLELSTIVPQQEAVGKQNSDRIHPIPVFAQLGVIDTTGVTDSVLLATAELFNRRLGRGAIDFSAVENVVSGLTQRLGGPALSPADLNWAVGMIDVFNTEMEGIRENQERIRSERAQREYVRQRLEINYPVEELVFNKDARNDFFNDLFAGVDSVPHEFFQSAFNPLTRGMRFEYFMDLIRDASVGKLEGWDKIVADKGFNPQMVEDLQRELSEDFLRYQTERRMRQTLHDVNAALYIASINGEQLWDHMQQFGSELGDVAFKTAGVRQMMDIYEQAIRESMAENNGYLKPEAVLGKVERDAQGKPISKISKGEIEERTKARFRELNKKGRVFVKNEAGNPVSLGKELDSWEIDRIFSIAQGMMITTERLVSLAAESKLPAGSYSSLFGQDILQQYSAYIHLLGKYGIGEKDLAAYLYGRNENSGPLGFFRRWNAKQLREVLERFEKDPMRFLNEPNEEEGDDLRYLMLRNPNRAGDVFTWLSWRAQERPDAVSMSEDFLKEGQEKMMPRLKDKYGIGMGIDLKQKAAGVDYGKNPADADIIAININRLRSTMMGASLDVIKAEINEYANWMGTALRLERMRTNLSRSPEEVRKLPKEEQARVGEQRKKAEGIIRQMARIQPHRLYLVSPEIRKRVNRVLLNDPLGDGKLNEAQQQEVSQILSNLSVAEGELLSDRENQLDHGKVFADLSVGDYIDKIAIGNNSRVGVTAVQIRDNEQQRRLSREFAAIVLRDYMNNKEKYFNEFASYKREYSHGFVLWSGDAPVDEFNVSALGPSGGFARRARDNKAQSEAIKEEIKLITNLKNLKHPDEVIQQLTVIHEKIVGYDAGKAKQAIAEKAEAIAKFYASDFLTNIPIVGIAMKQTGKASFAQIVYDDKSAAVWGVSDRRYFIKRLRQKNLITNEQCDILLRKTFAGKPDLAMDVGVTMAQFVALALALYMADKLLKDKQQ